MRQALLWAVFAFFVQCSIAQCNEIFISEYVEGSGNNRALEIYNPGSKPVSLADYRITCWINGTTSWTDNLCDTLSGTLMPNEVLVVVFDKRDSLGTGDDTPVNSKLAELAHLWLGARHLTMAFNGDDAISLDKFSSGQFLPIDIVGKIGQKPELSSQIDGHTGWTDSFPFHTGKGTEYTKNHTLIRKQHVNRGVNINPQYFDPTKEWDIYPSDMFDSLGTHRSQCNAYPASIQENGSPVINIYPNPASDVIHIQFSEPIASAEIRNASGKLLQKREFQSHQSVQSTLSLEVFDLPQGCYWLKVQLSSGGFLIRPFIKL
jgi:Lamin Tail Domain/Secretion system C-terminal sorting domain